MLERVVETSLRKGVEKRGGMCYKLSDTGRRGAPDRLMLEEIPERHRDIISKYVYFVETKKPGDKPKPHQVREHERLRKIGYRVDVIDRKVK